MKGLLIILILFLGFCVFVPYQAISQTKVIKKTVKKVVQPPIAPVSPPKTVTEEVVPTLSSPPPPPPSNYEIKYEEKGINLDLGGIYLLNRSTQQELLGVLGIRGNIIFSDPFLLGSRIGLSEDAFSYKVGLGFVFGNDINNNPINSIPIFVDSVIYLKEGSLFGMNPLLGAGINYNLFGNKGSGGALGGQIYLGILSDLGFGSGETQFIIGYSSINVNNIRFAEGIIFSVIQPL